MGNRAATATEEIKRTTEDIYIAPKRIPGLLLYTRDAAGTGEGGSAITSRSRPLPTHYYYGSTVYIYIAGGFDKQRQSIQSDSGKFDLHRPPYMYTQHTVRARALKTHRACIYSNKLLRKKEPPPLYLILCPLFIQRGGAPNRTGCKELTLNKILRFNQTSGPRRSKPPTAIGLFTQQSDSLPRRP